MKDDNRIGLHALSALLLTLVFLTGCTDALDRDQLNTRAQQAYAEGRMEEAEADFRAALELAEALGEADPRLVESLNNLGQFLRAGGRADLAAPHFLRALEIRERQLGPDAPELGLSYFNLAQHYKELGDLDEARRLCERALEIREKNFGTDDLQLGEVLNLLGLIALLQEDYAQAQIWLLRGIEIVRNGARAGHPSLSIYHGNLAQTYLAQAKLDEAEAHYRSALAIVRMNEGPTSLLMARAQKNLAEVLIFRGKTDEAEELYLNAVSIYESLGADAEGELGMTLNNVAVLYRGARRYADAEAAYLRAQQLLERQSQPTDYAASQFNLGRLYMDLSRYDDAEPLFVRSMAIYERILGPDHANSQLVRRVYADMLRSTGRTEEAEKLTAPAPPPADAE